MVDRALGVLRLMPLVVGILLVSFILNVWGIWWGLPELWHPDELVLETSWMIDQQTLNHHRFSYGSLPYFQLMLFALLPAYSISALFGITSHNTVLALSTLFARGFSALMGSSVVLIAYWTSRELFGQRAALVSALLLAVTAGLVSTAHFATTDIPSLFWISLSFLMSVYAFTRHRHSYYALAGLFAGFAAAVKFMGGIALIPLIAAYFLTTVRTRDRLVVGLAATLAGFLGANPVTFLLPVNL